jgi:hypothetical protein
MQRNSLLYWLFTAVVCVLSAGAGCYVGYKHYTEHYTAADTALGEEHLVPYPVGDALQLTEEALRGDGILFEVQPDNSVVTNWRPADADTRTGWFPLIIGQSPRYRYEIQAVAQDSHRTKIIVNARTTSSQAIKPATALHCSTKSTSWPRNSRLNPGRRVQAGSTLLYCPTRISKRSRGGSQGIRKIGAKLRRTTASNLIRMLVRSKMSGSATAC